jgi:15-cis-phytoene synthase
MASTIQTAVKTARPPRLQLRAAYAICRSIARSAAKNFYYGFLVLPRHKRNALSAVYAFMRHADDISDDETPGVTLAERRNRLSNWQDALHRVIAGQPTDDPVLLALADTQRRYKVPLELLDQLVIGTAMDLNEEFPTVQVPRPLNAPPPHVVNHNFEDLYRYCYHVASVVGLVTIRIFGSSHGRAEQAFRPALQADKEEGASALGVETAEQLAEQTGIAFQLTNILRDVKEDALRGRVYFPAEDLVRHGLTASDFIDVHDPSRLRPLLAEYAERARDYYKSAERLLPLIEHDSQPALWALVEIYRRLLERIIASDYKVFGEKVRVPTPEKVAVLTRGLLRRLK